MHLCKVRSVSMFVEDDLVRICPKCPAWTEEKMVWHALAELLYACGSSCSAQLFLLPFLSLLLFLSFFLRVALALGSHVMFPFSFIFTSKEARRLPFTFSFFFRSSSSSFSLDLCTLSTLLDLSSGFLWSFALCDVFLNQPTMFLREHSQKQA